jgi:putative ubiquitin-RnfH superfamily antitoxin RatB of RatAB toxin-antitoxin module
MVNEHQIDVEVLFVTGREEYSESLSVAFGSTIGETLAKSHVTATAQCYLNSESLSVGVWGKRMKLDARVAHGDRIEIYRDLIADPKELRRSGRLVSKRC